METKKRRVRRTPESYRKEIEDITDGEYSVLGDFEHSKTKLKHLHNACGTVWEIAPNRFVHGGGRCPRCCHKRKTRTPESYRHEVANITNGEYSVLGDFKKIDSKVALLHVSCGHVWESRPANFLWQGSRCPKCADSGAHRETNEQFIAKVYDLVGGEYSFLDEYTGANNKLKVVHNTCGYSWSIKPYSFVNLGTRCPSCAISSRRKTHEMFIKEVENVWGDEFTVLGKYSGVKDYVKVRHEDCGKVLQVRPDSLLSGFGHASCSRMLEAVKEAESLGFICDTIPKNLNDEVWITHIDCGLKVYKNLRHISIGYVGCHHCSKRHLRTPESYREEVAELTAKKYLVLGDFVNTKTKILHKHVGCGHEWEVSPNHFLQGYRCPVCIRSRGERMVADVLDSLSIKYTHEHTFDYLGLKRFDFYIPSLNIAIEYDGKQHFEAVDHWGGEEALKRTQESDALKNDFCDFMGIDLLRIPYWEYDNINEIVTNFIESTAILNEALADQHTS